MSYRIIVVDDEPMSLDNVKIFLDEEDMDVTCLSSGEVLLDYVKNNTPDMILLDIQMPDINGFDTYIALRKYEDRADKKHVPVIFVSDEYDAESEEYGLVMGASDYVTKPFNKAVLTRRINNAIKNSRRIDDLTEEATIDKLTGLFNKAKGTDRVSKLCKRKTGALAILDLDSFKLVNDLYGHETGDIILKTFSDVIRKNTRETDTACRIGGDEFMIFLEDLKDESILESLSLRLNSQLGAEAKRIMGEDHNIPLGISMGVVMVPEHGTEYDSLFEMADNALYKVKENGKHGYLVYGKERIIDKQSEEGLLAKLERTRKTLEERNDSDGTMVLGNDSFAVVYRFVMRYYRRYGGPATLLLFELNPKSEDGQERMIEAMDRFSNILEKVLRMSDTVMQSDSHSFFVMLTECVEDDIENVIARIINSFSKMEYSKDIGLEYVYKFMEKAEAAKRDQ
jgi:diguanylate cyclase (GGDEF)-like protein